MLINKKIVGFSFIIIIVFISGCFSGNWQISESENPSETVESNEESVSIRLEDDPITLELDDEFEITLTNLSETSLRTNEYYDLYYFEDEEWISIPLDRFVPDVQRHIEPNEEREFLVSLKPRSSYDDDTDELYDHEFEEGYYRIEKEYSVNDVEEIETVNLFFKLESND